MQWIDRKLQISFLHTHYVNSSYLHTSYLRRLCMSPFQAWSRAGRTGTEMEGAGGYVPLPYFCSHMKRAVIDDYCAPQIVGPSAANVEQQDE